MSMNTQQAMAYHKAVIESAKDWVNGNSCIGNQEELVIIADYYKVKLPKAMRHFQYSNNPNEVCLTGAPKTIYDTMGKLERAIRKAENM